MTSEQVQPKLDVLKDNLAKLAAIPQASYDVFSGDFRNVASALHLLQTSIQALIDLGSFLVVQRALPTPRTSHEIFERLEGAGLLPVGSAAALLPSSDFGTASFISTIGSTNGGSTRSSWTTGKIWRKCSISCWRCSTTESVTPTRFTPATA
jgi:uncharacterized protein YutE (UPF0331/DUF86 family)